MKLEAASERCLPIPISFADGVEGCYEEMYRVMDSYSLRKYGMWLRDETPLIGGWVRHRAIAALMKDGSPEAVHELVKAVNLSNGGKAQDEMLAALQLLTDQRGIDVVCEVWTSTRHAELAQLMMKHGWVASGPMELRVLSALKAGRLEIVAEGGTEVVEPLLQACKDSDVWIAQQARQCLAKLKNAEAINVVCARWVARREEWLTQAVEQGHYVAQKPVAVRVLSALKTGQLEAVSEGEAEVVEPLLQACEDRDPDIARRARLTLRQLQKVGAREALCRVVIERDLQTAREAALEARYTPNKTHERALFYFLTEQWDKYESLDFDHSLLRAAYEAGDGKLRQRIGERARRAGRVEWIEVAMGGRQRRRLGEMMDREWEVTLEVLSRSGRWAEMWRLAQEAPARWSARLLQRVSSEDWVPEGDRERAGYEELALLAARSIEVGLRSQIRCRVALVGHTESVTCIAISPDGQMLASGSWDTTVRLWSLPDGAPLKTLKGHTRQVNCLAFSPDGQVLASGDEDNMRLWRLPDGAPFGAPLRMRGGGSRRVNRLAISPDGRMLASGSLGGTVRLCMCARISVSSLK